MKAEKVLLGSRKMAMPHEILYLKSDVNYSMVYFMDGHSFLSSTTLKILEKRLARHRFFRTSRSVLINMDCIKNYENMPNKGIVELSNNETMEVSRRKNKILKDILN